MHEGDVRAHLSEMVGRYEGVDGWSFGELAPQTQETMPRGIVTFRMEISRIEAKAKLSQNKPRAERERVIEGLKAAGPRKDFRDAMQMVEDRLRERGAKDRTAHFVCALGLAWPDGHAETFEGRVSGTLVWPPRGTLGFGYDPMFVPDGHAVTFGEMRHAQKYAMSHRARAFAKFVEACLA